MTFKFILEILIFVSLSGMLYLMARALPRVNDEVFQRPTEIKTRKFSIFLEKLDQWLKSLLERWLRRLRVVVLKFDNIISQKLNSFKKEESKTNGLVIEQKISQSDNSLSEVEKKQNDELL